MLQHKIYFYLFPLSSDDWNILLRQMDRNGADRQN
jgi:hypothetical protein